MAAGGHRHDDDGVFQVRIHGRGGQGVVTAAELLSVAAFDEGRHAQAFPTLRLGAHRRAGRRRSAASTTGRSASHEPIAEPDALIVQDPTLLHQVDLFGGLGAGRLRPGQHEPRPRRARPRRVRSSRFRPERVVTVPATELAREHLGRPLPNAALLGAFAALTGVVSLDVGRGRDSRPLPGEVGRGQRRRRRAAVRRRRADTGASVHA